MVQTPGLIPNPGLILVMPTANIHLKVLKSSTGGFTLTIHAPAALDDTLTVHTPAVVGAHLEDASALAEWLDLDQGMRDGRREYPARTNTTVTAYKRIHTMTGEELVEIYVYHGDTGVGAMIVLDYPQTRALVAYLQN